MLNYELKYMDMVIIYLYIYINWGWGGDKVLEICFSDYLVLFKVYFIVK